MCYLLLEVDKHGEHTLSFHHTPVQTTSKIQQNPEIFDHSTMLIIIPMWKGAILLWKGGKGLEIGGTKKFSKVTRGWQGGANKYIENIKHKQKHK